MRASLLVFTFISGVLFHACQKPAALDANELQPNEDLLSSNQTDTTTLSVYTLYEDTLKADDLSASLLGSFIDPTFGQTRCAFATQFTLANSNPIIPESIEVDSVIFSLAYNGYTYGSLDKMNFIVRELDEALSKDSTYSSSYIPRRKLTNLVNDIEYGIVPEPSSFFFTSSDSLLPQLRIPLNITLGEQLLHPTDPTALDSDANFQSYFKGLYIETVQVNSGIIGLDLTNINSKITVYYRYDDGGIPDTTFFEFPITSDCARINHFEHDYTLSGVGLNTLDTDSSSTSLAFIQAAAGVKTRIDIPNLNALENTPGLLINKAELVIPFDLNTRLLPPSQVFLFYKDDQGVLQALPDQFTGNIGGNVDLINSRYRLNISQYIQQVLMGNITNGPLYLVSGNAGVSVNAVQLHGPNHSANSNENMRLILTYSN
jgi:Domain of unknown function (DUF4270)